MAAEPDVPSKYPLARLEMTAALKLVPAPTELIPITGAGHELVTKRNGDEISKKVVEVFRSFANNVA